MNKDTLQALVTAGRSTYYIAQESGVSTTTVRYWLKKHGLKTAHSQFTKKPYRCNECGDTDPAHFRGHRKSRCFKCHNSTAYAVRREKRQRSIEYRGGMCVICGFDKYPCSLDFHHLDPNTKDDAYESIMSSGWERIRPEIEKCVLLCKNCHTALHCGLVALPDRRSKAQPSNPFRDVDAGVA